MLLAIYVSEKSSRVAHGLSCKIYTLNFTDLDILYELQHGFRERRSCETQLIMLVDELSKYMQMGKQTDLILLDFSKAFDTVTHEKLLQKFHFYGIRGYTLKWIKGFFTLVNVYVGLPVAT